MKKRGTKAGLDIIGDKDGLDVATELLVRPEGLRRGLFIGIAQDILGEVGKKGGNGVRHEMDRRVA